MTIPCGSGKNWGVVPLQVTVRQRTIALFTTYDKIHLEIIFIVLLSIEKMTK